MPEASRCQNAVYLLELCDVVSERAADVPDEIAISFFEIAIRAAEIGTGCVFIGDGCRMLPGQECPVEQATAQLRRDYEALEG